MFWRDDSSQTGRYRNQNPVALRASGCVVSCRHFSSPLLKPMKIRLFTFALISALALGPIAVRAADEDQTELGAKMEKIGGAWRKVKAQISDASKNDDTLAKLATIKENMVAAQKFEPDLAKTKSGAEKEKFV